MQKLTLFVLALTLTCAFSAPAYCSFFKGIGHGLAGDSCSHDLDTGCTAAVDAYAQLLKVLGGDTSAYAILIADAMRVYSSATSSMDTCAYIAHFEALVHNIFKIYVIVMQHFNEIKEDGMCVVSSYISQDCLRLGECLGDLLKILTTKA